MSWTKHDEGQHSLWPACAENPADRPIVHGPAARADSRALVEVSGPTPPPGTRGGPWTHSRGDSRKEPRALNASKDSLPGARCQCQRGHELSWRTVLLVGGRNTDVIFVRWPAQADLRTRCRKEGVPRLLVVEAGAQPPISNDPVEDWVRPPVSRDDLEARVKVLQNRFNSRRVPTIDSTGTLSFGRHSITISTTQTELMRLLIDRFGEVVYRIEFVQRLATRTPTLNRNSLDLHIMRLRRRLLPLDLSIRTVWGRGYMLESATPAEVVPVTNAGGI
ncbi:MULTISPECIES: winged helix-turn-helix domain-containing protein [unclassified Streptomyces]|uniref:winged helix-turn-helix domain-containing protein n=1 Tax=unclassified Streptomyces TaxID=2593676 RepID=UPI0023F9532C|nr:MULTISPECIES: winged helix-turn-helix domain-containing protein [unclassified Streptomyces]